MKIKWYLFVIVIFFLASCKKDEEVVPVVELLLNGDAEAGSTFPENWFFSSGQTANAYGVGWSKEEANSGMKSLKLWINTADETNFAFWAQTISTDLPVGKTVTLKVKIKADLTGEGVSIAVRGDDTAPPEGAAEQFATTSGTTSITGKFDWKEYNIKLDKVEATTKSLTAILILNPGTTGSVYFDDASLSY